jgi:ATP/maltotriose-dependent transcriptional regulator MalT
VAAKRTPPGERLGDAASGTWPLVGRDAELRRMAELLHSGPRGLVLAGPAGVGKTRLATEFLELAEHEGATVLRIAATHASAALPLGVFAPLLVDVLGREPENRFPRANLIHHCAGAIVAAAKGRRLVLMVDNAHLLDDSSASLVRQMVAADAAFVVATLLTGEAIPEAILALWKDDSVVRMDVHGLSRDCVERLLTAVLGGPVDRDMSTRLVARSKGNVLFLRELVIGAISDGALVEDMGIWRLAGPIPLSTRLAELVEGRLAGLGGAERDLLELVSFGEPLGPAELTSLTDPELAESLERRGFLCSSHSGSQPQIRLAHPLFADVLRSRTPALRRRTIARLLAEAVEATGTQREEDLLRIGTWHLDSGGRDPKLLLAAARIARWRYDFPLAERLVRAALSAGAGFDAEILGAQLMFLLGHSAEAEEALNDVMPRASGDRERHIVAMTYLDHGSFMGGKIDRGLQLAKEIESTIEDPEFRDEVSAKRAALTAGFAGPRSSAALAEPILRRSRGRACVWSAIAVGYALSRVGRLGAALEATERGYAEHHRLVEPLEWYPWIHLFLRGEALAHSGQLEAAHRLATEQYEQSLEDHSPEAQAWFSWQLCKLVGERGFPHAAAVHGRSAVALFRQLDQPQFQHFALGHLSMALALSGDTKEAREALATLDALELGRPMYWACDVLQARAWVAAIDGDTPSANLFLHEARTLASSTGDHVGEASTLHAMARLGAASQAIERIAVLTSHVDGKLVMARAAHIHALARSDPSALESVSLAFENLGAWLLAAEAVADAATAWRLAGNSRNAGRAERRSGLLAGRCENPATPTIQAVRGRSQLTRAECQVARLAAAGASNQHIADHLFVSRRTVENQLRHVYEKLGLTGRHELPDALGEEP